MRPLRTRRTLSLAVAGILASTTVALAATVVSTRAPAGPDFTVGITPASVPAGTSASSQRSSARLLVVAGRRVRFRVAFAPRKGFSGAVRLSIRRVPRRMRARVSRVALSRTSSSATLTITTSRRSVRGTFPIVVQARDASGVRRVRALVSVRHVVVSPRVVKITAGERATVEVRLRRTTARTPSRLTLSGLPTGATAVFTPRSTRGPRATLVISTDVARTPVGLSRLTVKARTGSRTATARLRLQVTAPDSDPFVVHGDVAGLAPGVSRSMNLSLTNPYAYALNITDLRVAIASVTAPGASAGLPCGSADFAVTAFAGSYPLRLPPRATLTLADLGVPDAARPHVTMLNRAVNQDGCKSAALTFAYGGSATR